ncbi:hypothetical protein HDU78_007701 [Chytriomyces hyalinus]|nr:hypothetical protein HDU78_007701 [Chytriomyces hyalinus]
MSSSGADIAALEEAIPPCALACTTTFTSLEAVCAAATTIVTCGRAACTGPDLFRFNALVETIAPICESVQVSATVSRSAVTSGLSQTSVPFSSPSNLVRTSSSNVSPTASSVPASAGSSTVSENNSIGLYVGVGVGIAVAIIAAVVFLVTRSRRKDSERLRQVPHEDLQHQHKAYDTAIDSLSTTVASPAVAVAISLDNHTDAAHSSESQGSSDRVHIASSIGDNRSSAWDATIPIPASSRAPALDTKLGIMNAAYAAPTYPIDKKRDIFTTDGATTSRQFIVADSKLQHHVGNAREIPHPPSPAPAPGTLDPNEWGVSEVVAWARAIPHFGTKLGNIMLEYQVSGHVLMGLTRDSMKDELGLVFGEVTHLEAGIAQLRGLLVQDEGLPPGYDA